MKTNEEGEGKRKKENENENEKEKGKRKRKRKGKRKKEKGIFTEWSSAKSQTIRWAMFHSSDFAQGR